MSVLRTEGLRAGVDSVLKVKNKKVIARLSGRSMKAARTRNIMAVCAIVLTTALFTILFTLGIGTINALQINTMRQAGGDGHAVLKYIDDTVYEAVKDHELISEISYNMILNEVENEEFLKRRAEFWYHDEVGLKHSLNTLTAGHWPEAENELAVDTTTLKLLNVEPELGNKVTLRLNIQGESVERDFVLSGWWEADDSVAYSAIYTSHAYVDAHSDELKYTYKEDMNMVGSLIPYIKFKNSFGMEEKLRQVVRESGYTMADETAENYVEGNVNWAYLSSGMSADIPTILGLCAGGVLIILTGYLIIYNIFQISVIRDIRFYGLLKTIGTTGRQLKRIIWRQAMILSLIGVPIGLAVGFLVGKELVPLVVGVSSADGMQLTVSASPIIFIGSALFAIITVWISVRKPGKIAAGVSPVEAVRYSDRGISGKKAVKRTTDGGKLYKMALSNLGRSKKRTVTVLLSLSLSLVLLNTVFSISGGFDMDKYLFRFVDTDFLIAHAAYFNPGTSFYGPDVSVNESYIEAVKSQPGFEEGGKIYYSYGASSIEANVTESEEKYINLNADGNPAADVYGLDALPLSRLEVIEGDLDIEKLKTGNYIIEGIQCDDNGEPYDDYSEFSIGDTVTLHHYNSDSEEAIGAYTIIAKVKIKTTNHSRRWSTDYVFYLPSEVYLPLYGEESVMSYAYNVKEEYTEDMDTFLADYTDTVEPVMNYESKLTYEEDFGSLQNLIVMVGGILSGIIGFIGILNFTNSILTSIITRRREFAMLESVGMTRKQLKRMLCFEGIYYVAGTVIMSAILSIAASLVVVKGLIGTLWFFSYRFIILPLIVCFPVLLIISVIIPLAAFTGTGKESVTERLRDTE